MNKHVMAIAVCLALQPVVSLGAETMVQPGVNERGSKQSFEIQRGRAVPEHLAKSCIPMRPGNPNGVASQEANRPGSVRNDCEPMTQPRAMPDGSRLVHTFPDGVRLYAVTDKSGIQKLSAIDQRGRALKVEIVQNPPKDLLIGPNDAIERGNKQRAAEGGGRRQATLSDVDNPTLVKKCIVKILAPSSLLGPNDKLLGPNNLIGPNNSLYWDMAASGMGCPKG